MAFILNISFAIMTEIFAKGSTKVICEDSKKYQTYSYSTA
ncbi:hypothetical protein HCCG_01268 [Helicobacter cinaedi CCUG 18818 = ATCC BAA-847]|uniref:Uncharacterized protein n=1 Tax=Helicobacter cinaedi CCUG 18818 = ATCC BAA-847 TaxID=537971 RepID=A0ABN0BAX3_9HELI|nr:hypothetical protein HCCG_01268 [Helicobacter cinaedi CCUG 18818 = ATCC BAA-847]